MTIKFQALSLVEKVGHFTHEIKSSWPLNFKHSHWWKRRSWSKFYSHYAWGANGVYKWMQDGCKESTYIPTWHRLDHVSWSLGPFSKTTSWEVGLTQNRETMTHRTLTTIDLFYFYHVWGPAWIEIQWSSIWLRARHIWLHTTLEDLWPHYMIVEVCWDGLWTLFFWALTISWSRLLARVWSGPKSVPTRPGMGHATPKLGHPGFLGGGTGISWGPPMSCPP